MISKDVLLDDLYDAVFNGDAHRAVELAAQALDAAVLPTELLFDAMIPALEEVGRRFESGEAFLPEMLIAARAMQAVMDRIRPLIVAAGVEKIGTFVIGTVAGDIHDVGKKLVVVMLEGAGFEVIDLGINVPAEAFVEAIRTHRPQAVGLSAFLTTTLPELGRTIAAIEEAGLRDDVTILIGGAPVNDLTVAQTGADGFAADASSAVRLAKELLDIPA
ncbi:MAG TPA: corrinoid protein [Acidimicrobiia bacterium]|nr:corrinoid protein [Acidimicrobiia bacterium]